MDGLRTPCIPETAGAQDGFDILKVGRMFLHIGVHGVWEELKYNARYSLLGCPSSEGFPARHRLGVKVRLLTDANRPCARPRNVVKVLRRGMERRPVIPDRQRVLLPAESDLQVVVLPVSVGLKLLCVRRRTELMWFQRNSNTSSLSGLVNSLIRLVKPRFTKSPFHPVTGFVRMTGCTVLRL